MSYPNIPYTNGNWSKPKSLYHLYLTYPQHHRCFSVPSVYSVCSVSYIPPMWVCRLTTLPTKGPEANPSTSWHHTMPFLQVDKHQLCLLLKLMLAPRQRRKGPDTSAEASLSNMLINWHGLMLEGLPLPPFPCITLIQVWEWCCFVTELLPIEKYIKN